MWELKLPQEEIWIERSKENLFKIEKLYRKSGRAMLLAGHENCQFQLDYLARIMADSTLQTPRKAPRHNDLDLDRLNQAVEG